MADHSADVRAVSGDVQCLHCYRVAPYHAPICDEEGNELLIFCRCGHVYVRYVRWTWGA